MFPWKQGAGGEEEATPPAWGKGVGPDRMSPVSAFLVPVINTVLKVGLPCLTKPWKKNNPCCIYLLYVSVKSRTSSSATQ